MDSGRGTGSQQMPAELQEMYDLYTQEVHGASAQRNTRFLNELNEILRVRWIQSCNKNSDTSIDIAMLSHSHLHKYTCYSIKQFHWQRFFRLA